MRWRAFALGMGTLLMAGCGAGPGVVSPGGGNPSVVSLGGGSPGGGSPGGGSPGGGNPDGGSPGGGSPGGGSVRSAAVSATSAMAATGTVRGLFTMVGGPVQRSGSQPPARPLSGTISFSGNGGRRINVTVGATGTFRVILPAGTYAVSGRSDSIQRQDSGGASTGPPCSQPLTARVRAGETTRVTVICAVP